VLICSKCGKVIASTQPEVHYGICASCGVNDRHYTLANFTASRKKELDKTVERVKNDNT